MGDSGPCNSSRGPGGGFSCFPLGMSENWLTGWGLPSGGGCRL